MSNTKCNTHVATIFIAGDIQQIKATCRKYCLQGLCVTVTPTDFIFTGGTESGAAIGLINYARFPRVAESINELAIGLAHQLMLECCQRSCSVVTPIETHYFQNETITVPR